MALGNDTDFDRISGFSTRKFVQKKGQRFPQNRKNADQAEI
jgi:hypothetical protein